MPYPKERPRVCLVGGPYNGVYVKAFDELFLYFPYHTISPEGTTRHFLVIYKQSATSPQAYVLVGNKLVWEQGVKRFNAIDLEMLARGSAEDGYQDAEESVMAESEEDCFIMYSLEFTFMGKRYQTEYVYYTDDHTIEWSSEDSTGVKCYLIGENDG